jgi:hypothetical protein
MLDTLERERNAGGVPERKRTETIRSSPFPEETMSRSGSLALALVLLASLGRDGSAEPMQVPPTAFTGQDEILTPAEVEAIWSLVKERESGTQIAWVRAQAEKATLEGVTIQRAAHRLHASLGLDVKLRDDLERSLLGSVAADAVPLAQRVTLALLVLELGEPAPATARTLAPVLRSGLAQTGPKHHFAEITGGLQRLARVLPQREAQALCRGAAEALIVQLSRHDNTQYAEKRIAALLDFAARLDLEERTLLLRVAASRVLAAARRLQKESFVGQVVAHTYPLLAALPKHEAVPLAREAAGILLARMEEEDRPNEIVDEALDLARFAALLPDDEVARIGERACPRVLDALANVRLLLREPDEADGLRLELYVAILSEPLPEIVKRWRPADAQWLLEAAALRLVSAILENRTRVPQDDPDRALSVLRRILESPLPDSVGLHRAILTQLERGFNAATEPERLARIAGCLGGVVASRPTPEGQRICRAAARDLGQRLLALTAVYDFGFPLVLYQRGANQVKILETILPLTDGFVAVVDHLPAAETVSLLLPRVPHGPFSDRGVSYLLAAKLVAAVERLDPVSATPARAETARLLSCILNQSEPSLGYFPGFLDLSERVADAPTLEALAFRIAAAQRERTYYQMQLRMETLPFLRKHLPADVANRVTREVAEELARVNGKDAAGRAAFEGDHLADLALFLPRKRAAELCAATAEAQFDRMRHVEVDTSAAALLLPTSRNGEEMTERLRGLVRLLAYVPRERAEALQLRMVRQALEWVRRAPIEGESPRASLLPLIYPVDRVQRSTAVTATIGELMASGGRCPGAPALLAMAARPLPEPPSGQVLVEMLKHPLCVGAERREVLDVLEMRYGRTFADQWEFVRFATERKLDLDLTSEPRRETPGLGSQPSP